MTSRSASPALPKLLFAASALLWPVLTHAQAAPSAAPSQDPYSGVAHPPADDNIVANEDTPAPAARKPLPGVPAETAATESSRATSAAVARPATAAPTPVENPDYGIVTSTHETVAPSTMSATSENSTRLIARPQNPDYGVIGMIPSPSNQLAEGTDIHVRLLQSLSTRHTETGENFRAQVAADVFKEGRVVIPSGSELRGRVVGVTQGHRLGAHATIRLRPDSVILPDGTAYHLFAQAVSSSAPGTRTDQEGGIQTKMHVYKDLSEYGAGAGGGAIVGGVFGGPVGAGAGAIVGTGIVTTHLLLQKPAEAHIEQGSEVVFSLTEPMDLLPTRN